ncbi:hypothetical protein Ae706Ps2_0418c [Pseudonocardia sp. Ae706_Ps2]|nr:hypothetical protein Ae505Ps2_4087c [Pseudonocardia sp. Ae505_Ps2]OLM21986.1 hypothetical protein Ae706Ps2_0418c [Pseudonocardia sp. Ae706_Ps2]
MLNPVSSRRRHRALRPGADHRGALSDRRVPAGTAADPGRSTLCPA